MEYEELSALVEWFGRDVDASLLLCRNGTFASTDTKSRVGKVITPTEAKAWLIDNGHSDTMPTSFRD